MANENFKYAYFALIKANIDNEYNEAMLQFILYVIKKKHYDEIDVEALCKDFEKIIGFVRKRQGTVPCLRMNPTIKI